MTRFATGVRRPRVTRERDFETAWLSIKPNGGIGEATLFWLAHDYGWRESAQPRANGHAAPAAARPAARPKAPDATTLWAAGEPADGHPYLSASKIPPAGLRVVSGNRLAVPFRRLDGELSTLQLIGVDGVKKNLAGVHFGDSLHVLGEPAPDSRWRRRPRNRPCNQSRRLSGVRGRHGRRGEIHDRREGDPLEVAARVDRYRRRRGRRGSGRESGESDRRRLP